MNYEITEGAMRTHAQKIKSSAELLNECFQTIKGEIEAISNAWTDELGNQYVANFKELQELFPQFYATTVQFGDFINVVVDKYIENVYNKTKTAVDGVEVNL